MWKHVYLPPSMMATGIIGFIISAVYTYSGDFEQFFGKTLGWGENIGLSLGFSFCLVFVVIFIASTASITPSDKD